MAGIRPIDVGYDPEKDPEYAAALARYAASRPASEAEDVSETPEARQSRIAAEYMDFARRGGDLTPFQTLSGAPEKPASSGGVPRPMGKPAAAMAELAAGATGSDRKQMIDRAIAAGDDLTPYLTKPSADARPPPTTRAFPTPPMAGDELPDRPSAGQVLAQTRAPGVREALKGPDLIQAGIDALADRMSPLPDVAMPLPGMPPPAKGPPVVQVGRPADVVQAGTRRAGTVLTMESAAPPTPDLGAPPASKPTPLQIAQQMRQARSGPPPSRPDPLALAMEQARGNRLIAGLTRAGGAAIGRGRGPGYDNLDENADRPLQELQMRRQDAAQQAALAKGQAAEAADADPNSAQSQMARALVAQVVPGLAKSPGFEGASYATLAKGPLGKFIESYANVQKARIAADAKRRPVGGVGGAFEKDIQKLGKDTEGYAQIQNDLATLEGAISGSGDIPGVGVYDSRKPAFMQSADDVNIKQAATRVASQLLHEQSGAAVTPSEAERFMEGRGMGQGATEEQFRSGVRALATELRAALKAKAAKYTPATRAALQRRGGVTDLPAGAAPAGAPSADDLERLWSGG